MSLSAIMNTALTGLFTSQSALRVTTSNITNVNTPGYARSVVHQEAVVNSGLGGGVKIADVQRVIDTFLEESFHSSLGQARRYTVERQFHDRVQALLGRPDSSTSLSGRLDTLFQKAAAAANDPSKQVLRQDLLAGVQDFASEISRITDELQRLRADASNQIAERVTTINRLLERIDSLNPLITRETVLGNPTGALEEQRAQAVRELAELVDIRVHDQGNGAIHITTGDGTVLLGGARYLLQYNSPGSATAETNFPPITLHSVDPTTGNVSTDGPILDGALLGGEIKGLIEMRDRVLPEMAAQLGRLGGTVMDQLNAIHNASSAFPPPASLSGINTGLVGTDLHGFSGRTAFKVTDSSGNVVQSVTIDFDALPPGATINDVVAMINAGLGGAGTVTFANGRMSFAAAGAGNGVMIVDDPANPSNRGGRGFSHFFGMNDLLEAKVPSHFSTGFKGTDAHGFTPGSTISFDVVGANNRVIRSVTVTIPAGDFNDILAELNDPAGLGIYMNFAMNADGSLSVTPKAGMEDVKLHVKSDTTARGDTGLGFSRIFGLGERFLADQASGLKVRDAVANAPQRLALGKADFNAGIGQTALSSGNNDGARAWQELELQILSFDAVGELSAMKGTLAQYSAAILGNFGLRAAQATTRQADTVALATEVETRRNDVSGVNLDEELSNMIVFQNSYNAATRIITTVREMYDALLGLV